MGFDNDCIVNIYTVVPEYFCPVCRTLVYPNEALQTPCSHLYCKPCLLYIASSTQACPYDGYLVTEAGSKPVAEINKTLVEAIGEISVRCLYHRSGCMWQGSLSECKVHCSGCAFGDYQVICMICHIQIGHRQAEEHAQICNVNVMNPQPQQGTQNVWDAATSGVVVSSDSECLGCCNPEVLQALPQQLLQAPPQQYPLQVQPSVGPGNPELQRPYGQSQALPYGPPGFVSSSAPGLCSEQARTPILKHPGAFQMDPAPHLDQGFPHQHVFGDSSGTMSAHPHLGEPSFQSSYACQGGSDFFGNSRKRKAMSTGWCRICKVDCENVQGLQKHVHTSEHKKMAMVLVRQIKQTAALMAKTSNAHSGLGEASKLGGAGPHGCGSKP